MKFIKIILIIVVAILLFLMIVGFIVGEPKQTTKQFNVLELNERFDIPALSAKQQKIRNDYIAGMKYLYTELQKIKTNPEFLQYGLAQKIGKEWHDQYKQFDSIKEFKGIDFMTQIIPDIDILPGDLEILARAYFSSNPDKEYITNTEKRFQTLLDNY